MTSLANNPKETDEIRPLFICYRQIDGKRYGRWLADRLKKSSAEREEKVLVYFDQTMTAGGDAGDDWESVHGASLRRAHTFLVICTPGLYSEQGDQDWVHREIDWWLQNRTIAPVIVDTTGEGTRWIPKKIHDRWPKAQRVNVDKDLWANSTLEEREVAACQVVDQILGNRSERAFNVIREDLKKTQVAYARMRLAVTLLGIFAVFLAVATFIAVRATTRANTAEADAQQKANEAKSAQIEAENKRREAQLATNRAEDSECQANQLLEIATEGLANSLVQEGFARRKDEPEVSLRLAELASRLTESTRPAELLRSSLVAAPVWCRIGANSELPIEQEFMPPSPRKSDPFATDKEVGFVLGPDTSHSYPPAAIEAELNGILDDFTTAHSFVAESPSLDWDAVDRPVLALRRVPDGEKVATLRLEKNEWLIAPEPSATNLVCTRTGDEEFWDGRVFELTPKGLETPSIAFTQAKDFSLTNGSWPCYVLSSDGTVKQFNSAESMRELGHWNARRIFAHPKGNAIALLTLEGIVWIGTSKPELEVVELPWKGSPFNELGIESGCKLLWGPKPQHMLLYRIDADGGGEHLQPKTTLQAFDAKTKKTQLVAEHIVRANSLTRLICETDENGERVCVTAFEQSSAKKIIETAGGTLEVINLKWANDKSGELVEVSREPDGLLRGERRPATKVSARCAAFAPNGNFIVVASDLRTSSGTGNGTGLVESWDLSPLDSDGSAATGAIKLPFGVSSVVRLAYSQDSSRVAIWDHAGVTHLYRVSNQPPSPFDSHRLPQSVIERFAVGEVETYGPRNRFWLADFGGGDVRVYDLAAEQLDTRISSLSNVLATTWRSSDQCLIIVTREAVLKLKDGKLTEEHKFQSPAVSANAGGDVICVLSDSQLVLLDRGSLSVIALSPRADLPEDFDKVLSNLVQRHSDNPSRRSICSWLRNTPTSISVCFNANGKVTTYELTVRNGGLESVHSSAEIELNTSREWSSIRRSPSGKHILIVEGDNDSTPSLFRQAEAATGSDAELYRVPAQGWPGKLMEILDVASVADDQIAILFRYYYSEPDNSNAEFDLRRSMNDLKKSYQGFFIGLWQTGCDPCNAPENG